MPPTYVEGNACFTCEMASLGTLLNGPEVILGSPKSEDGIASFTGRLLETTRLVTRTTATTARTTNVMARATAGRRAGPHPRLLLAVGVDSDCAAARAEVGWTIDVSAGGDSMGCQGSDIAAFLFSELVSRVVLLFGSRPPGTPIMNGLPRGCSAPASVLREQREVAGGSLSSSVSAVRRPRRGSRSVFGGVSHVAGHGIHDLEGPVPCSAGSPNSCAEWVRGVRSPQLIQR
jgi:hypothetical protein